MRIITLLLLPLLAACATSGQRYAAEVSTEYQLRVQQPFDDLPNGTYLDFQQGRLIPPGNLDRWSTYCRLYVYNPDMDREYRSAVAPGVIDIREVKAAWQSSDYPSRPFFGHLSWGVRDVPAYYLYQVGMRLSAPDQPDIRSLICYRKWAVPNVNEFPTLAEIRKALGDQISITAPN